jgi:hypothetical protein
VRVSLKIRAAGDLQLRQIKKISNMCLVTNETVLRWFSWCRNISWKCPQWTSQRSKLALPLWAPPTPVHKEMNSLLPEHRPHFPDLSPPEHFLLLLLGSDLKGQRSANAKEITYTANTTRPFTVVSRKSFSGKPP